MPSILELQQQIAQLEEENCQLKQSLCGASDIKNMLTETEILHSSIINSTNDLIWAVDASNFELLSFNDGFLDFFKKAGYVISKGMTPELFLPLHLAEKWKEQYTYTLKQGKYSAKFNTILNNRILLLTFNLLKKEDETWGISVFAQDITEQEDIKNKLEKSEERFRTITDSAPILMVVSEKSGENFYINKKVTSILGYDLEDVKNDALWANLIYSGEPFGNFNIKNWNESVQYAKQNNMIEHPLEFPIRCKDGTIKIIEYRLARCSDIDIIIGVDVSERWETQKALKQSEQNYREIFDATSDALLVHEDFTGVIVDVNQTAIEMYGYENKEEMRGLKIEERSAVELGYTAEKSAEIIKNIGNSQTKTFEWLAKKKNGTNFWVEVALKRSNIGGTERIIAVIRDISERKANEALLRKSEQNYREIFDATSDALLVHDKDSIIFIDVNQAAVDIYGFDSKEEMKGLSINDLSATEQGYTIERAIALMQETQEKKQHTFEWMAKRKNKSLFWCEVSLKRGVINNNIHTIAAVRDISYRKAIELALHETKDNYQSLYDGMIDAYVAVTMDGRITECNQAYCNMLGYDKSEIYNLRYQDVTPEKWHAFEASILEKQVLTRSYSEVYEKEYRHQSGNIFPIELRTHLIKRNNELEGMWAIVRDISARKKTETALRESEERYRKITESITDYTYRVEIDSHNNNQVQTTHSAACVKLLGYTTKDFETIPNLWFDIIYPDDQQTYISFLQDFLQTAQTKTIEHRIVHKRGETRWVSNTLLPFETIDGYVSQYEGIIKDITERKQVEQALNESKARYEALFENSITSNTLYDVQMRVVLMNKKGLQILKLEAQEVIGKITSEVLDRTQSQIIEQRIRTVLETGKITTYESKFVMPLGEMWFQTMYMPVHNKQQQMIGVLAISQDVSEQKQLELSVRKSENRFRTLFNNAPLGIALIDSLSGQILTLNAMAAQIVGRNVKEMIAMNWMQITHPCDVQLDIDKMAQLNAGNINQFRTEKRYIRPDESIVWVALTVTRLQTEDQASLQHIAMIEDITERKQLEQQLFTITIQTEEQERQRFAQELHDGIGPLLAAANMYIEWILKPNSKADVVTNLEKIHSIIKDAHRTIRQISFNLSPHILQNFGLHTALDSYCEKIRESSSIEIHIACHCTVPRNELIETTLYRILTECITNTLKHAQASKIGIELCSQGEYTQIRYNDNGLGFDAEAISRTGLGLQNMQNRIKAINGKLVIESHVGQGTNIVIYLQKE